jgi:Resolvase, N terminal domain
MIRAAIYARISYDPDARAVGVDRQREDCLRLAASRGWTVVAEYIDNNVSASKYSRKARTQYLRLLDDIEAGRIDAVAIWMEDRLQRQVLELAEFLKVCDAAGVTRIPASAASSTCPTLSSGRCFTSRQPWPRRRLKSSAGVSCASGFKQRRTASLMEADGGGSGFLVLARTESPQSRSSKSAS